MVRLGESLAQDIWSLLGLAKLFCLAYLYEHLDRHSVLAAADPVTWALANVLDQIPIVHSEMRICHDRVKELLEELSDGGRSEDGGFYCGAISAIGAHRCDRASRW